MKHTAKLLAALLALTALTLTLTACGGTTGNDDGDALVTYDTGSGLTISLPDGLTADETEGAEAFLYNDNFMITVVRDSFEELTDAGLEPETLSDADYAALAEQAFELPSPFAQDSYGNLYATYAVEDETDGNFSYYATIRKGSDAFWIVNLVCFTEDAETYMPLFEEWGNTIAVA